ncbi:alpha/beta hydrolase family protein [Streptomyces sp. Amel2xB2]|nr:alpha/beta hydrolase family protein [Streptomyces sp. Amel2xB2]
MTGLPPVHVLAGTRDILLADARRLHERASAAGVPVALHEAPGQVHACPLWPVAEGHAAREQIIAGLRECVPAPRVPDAGPGVSDTGPAVTRHGGGRGAAAP